MNPLNDTLRKADEALKRQVEEKQRLKNERDRQYIMEQVAQSLPGMMAPLLERVSENSRMATDEVLAALQQVKIEQPVVDVKVETPKAEVTVKNEPIKIPKIDVSGIESAIERGIAKAKFPTPEVTVNAPVVNVEAPETPEPFDGEVTLKGVDRKRPLPVMMMDLDGKPMQMGGGSVGGGRGDFFTIKDIQNSSGGSIIDNDGFVKVTGAFNITSSATSTYAQLVDSDGNGYTSTNPLQIAGSISTTPGLQISGAADSVNVIQSVTLDVKQLSGSSDSVSVISTVGLTDTQLRASHIDVQQLSGSIDSVYITGVASTIGVVTINPDGNPTYSTSSSGGGSTTVALVNVDGLYYNSDNPLPVTFSAASVQPVSQVSGQAWSVSVTDIYGSTATNLINPDGRLKVELPTGSSGLTDTELRASHLDVQQLSGATDSVNVVSTVGLTDTQLRASTLDVKQVSGSSDSVNVLSMPAVVVTSITNTIASNLVDSSGVVYSGSNPVPVTGTVSTGGLTDAQLRASTIDIKQVSGSIDSVNIIGTPTVSVTDIFASVGANVINPDGRIKVELPTGSSGLTDTELRASHLDVQQLSGSIDSVYVTGIANSAFTELQNGDGRLRVSVETGGSGLTDSELRATSVPVSQVSGASFSTNVLGTVVVDGSGVTQPVSGTVAVSGVTNTVNVRLDSVDGAYTGSNPLPVTLATKLDYTNDTISVIQLSGAVNSINVTTINGVTPSVGTGASDTGTLRVITASNSNLSTITASESYAIQDLPGVFAQLYAHATTDVARLHTGGFDSQGALRVSHATDIATSVYVTGASGTIAAINVDSSGVGYSGSNPLPVTVISGANDSIATMPFEVMTTNRTSKSDGADIRPKADKQGRQLMRPVTARDLVATAYVSVSTGTEATLLTAAAGTYLDLIKIVLSNNSTAAVGVDIRATSAGNIIGHFEIPANGVVGESLQVPWPQDSTGNSWTVDLPDITGTTVTVSALFTKEV